MDINDIKKAMHSEEIYYCDNDELVAEQLACLELLYDFNQTRPSEQAKRSNLLKKMFAEVGEYCYIEPPLHCNWGGKHVHMGHSVYANFNLTIVDDTHIYIGNNVMFGPNVILASASHPISPKERIKIAQYNKEIHIKNNVWLGAGAIVLPGITIGENTIIGAGSIVTKDIPANVVAVGNPCRVLKKITTE